MLCLNKWPLRFTPLHKTSSSSFFTYHEKDLKSRFIMFLVTCQLALSWQNTKNLNIYPPVKNSQTPNVGRIKLHNSQTKLFLRGFIYSLSNMFHSSEKKNKCKCKSPLGKTNSSRCPNALNPSLYFHLGRVHKLSSVKEPQDERVDHLTCLYQKFPRQFTKLKVL